MHKGHNTAYESIGWIAGIAIRGGVLCATHLRSENYYVRVGECVVATGVRALFVQVSNVSRLAKISNSFGFAKTTSRRFIHRIATMAPSIDEQPAVPALAVSALPMGVDGLRSPRVSMHTPRACQHTPRRASTFEVSAQPSCE